MEQKPKTIDAEAIYAEGKNDHKIINAALYLKENELKKSVTLVTKDINLRIKAKALALLQKIMKQGRLPFKAKRNQIQLKVLIRKESVKYSLRGA
jgi:PhoH-like ATPase